MKDKISITLEHGILDLLIFILNFHLFEIHTLRTLF